MSRKLLVGLTAALAVLTAGAAAAGLLVDTLYADRADLRAMYRGYDFVTLVVAAPGLAGAALAARRRDASGRTLLVWAAGLAFVVYNAAFFVFGAAFNKLFLVHVVVLVMAAATLWTLLATADLPAVAAGFGRRTPVRAVSALLLFLAVGLGGIWTAGALRFAFTGRLPEPGRLLLPVAALHLTYALDLTVLVPAYVAAAVLLWRRHPWGLVWAPVLLVSGTVHQLSYLSALWFQARDHVPGASGFDWQEVPILVAYVVAATVMLRVPPLRNSRTAARV